MIKAQLKAPKPSGNRHVQSERFKSEGSTIFDHKGHAVAMQRAGVWHAPDGVFISIDFDSPVTVHFKNADLNQSETFGPYAKLRIINGGMWAFPEYDAPELIAQFEAAMNLWHIVARPASGMPEFVISE